MKIIALEEHYWDDEVATHFKERGPEMRNPEMLQRLRDLDTLRIKEMDEAGIDLQIVSHGAPATQRIDAETAVPLAKRANDRLFESIKKHPGRLKGFAVLPTANPKAAADEAMSPRNARKAGTRVRYDVSFFQRTIRRTLTPHT